MDQETIRRVLDILRPASADRAKCADEVARVIQMIASMGPDKSTRKIRSDIKKLVAAKKVVEQPGWWVPELARELTKSIEIASWLSKLGPKGRNRGLSFRRKIIAADLAFRLLVKWGSSPPTLTANGAYFDLTAALCEAATGVEDVGEVRTACEGTLRHARSCGYNPDTSTRSDLGIYLGYDIPGF